MNRLRAGVEEPGPVAGLTGQERTLLDLTGEGLSNRQIAERLCLAEKTVKNYVSGVLPKPRDATPHPGRWFGHGAARTGPALCRVVAWMGRRIRS
jgi:hypothetical protein